MLESIDVPYRVIDVAAGDLGSSAARKFDCEAWVPTQQTYRELTSTSNCTTFQARRLATRYRDENGKPQTAATLNGTLATTRWLVAILENHQQPDGSVRVPDALVPYGERKCCSDRHRPSMTCGLVRHGSRRQFRRPSRTGRRGSRFRQRQVTRVRPQGNLPRYAPGHDSFLGEFPLSHDALVVPAEAAEDGGPLNLQIEPEVALACEVDWQG